MGRSLAMGYTRKGMTLTRQLSITKIIYKGWCSPRKYMELRMRQEVTTGGGDL